MGILRRVCNGELRDHTREGYNVQCSFQAQVTMQMSQVSSGVKTVENLFVMKLIVKTLTKLSDMGHTWPIYGSDMGTSMGHIWIS